MIYVWDPLQRNNPEQATLISQIYNAENEQCKTKTMKREPMPRADVVQTYLPVIADWEAPDSAWNDWRKQETFHRTAMQEETPFAFNLNQLLVTQTKMSLCSKLKKENDRKNHIKITLHVPCVEQKIFIKTVSKIIYLVFFWVNYTCNVCVTASLTVLTLRHNGHPSLLFQYHMPILQLSL